jgi:hypothetical protein
VNVPSKYVTKDGYKLGAWITSQRNEYKKGKLSKEKQQALEQIPGSVWEIHMLEPWYNNLKHLNEFAKREGHTRVQHHYVTEDGCKLGLWVGSQRTMYRKGMLLSEHKQALEQIPGWTWNPLENRWAEAFKCLRDFVDREGHANVPSMYATLQGYNLGQWVETQQRAYKKGKLSVQRREALENMPGWVWDSPSQIKAANDK